MARSGHREGMGRRITAALTATAMAATGLVLATGSVAGASGSSTSTGSTCSAASTATSSELNSTSGITKNSVTVGNVATISGPVPGLFQGAPYGAQAYFDYINSKGGINGRKIYLQSYDDGFSGTSNESETQTAVGKDFALVGNFSLFDNYGCDVLAKNPGVPDVSVTLDPGTNSLPNVYSPQPLAQGAPEAPYTYLKSKYPKDVKSVANLVSNTDTAIAQWQGQEKVMQGIGYKFTYVREVSPLESDFTTDVINMRNKGVKMVLLTDGDYQIFAALIKDMAEQNFHPAVMMSAGPIYDDNFIKAAGGANNVKNIYLIQGDSLYLGQDSKTIPAVATFNKWVQKAHPGFDEDLFTVFGWTSAQLFAQALKAAGENPTRGKVLSQLKKITNFSASNLIAASNPAKKIPPNCVVFSQIQNGKFVRISPTKSGYYCKQPYNSLEGKLPKVSMAS